jgi:hypothetical protein
MRAGNIGDVARSIGASSPAFQYGQGELSRREQRVSYFEVDDARTEGGGGIEIRVRLARYSNRKKIDFLPN